MKKTLIFLTLFLFLFAGLTVEAGNKKEKTAKKTEKPLFRSGIDSVSYAIGINVGTGLNGQLKQFFGDTANLKLLLKGFETGIKGKTPLLSNENAGTYIQQYLTKVQEKLTLERKEKNIAFLTENAKKEGVVSLPSGLQYKILKEGTGEKPKGTNDVKVHYEGQLIDGVVFDSSIERNEPATFTLNKVIPGWTEALQLMTVGSKWRLFIPANLGYGEAGAGKQIPPFSTLIFDVELIEIVK